MSEDVKMMKEAAERARQQQLQQQQQEAAARLAQSQALEKAMKQAEAAKQVEAVKAGYKQFAETVKSVPRVEAVKAGYKQYAETRKPEYAATQVAASIGVAETAIKQAESMSESWGSKIQWGDKTYDLGTTGGWKDYKQAIRDAKSDINKAKNTLRLIEAGQWEEKTSREAKKAVDDANEVIRKANQIIEQQNVEVQKIVAANQKLLDAKFTHDYKPKTQAEFYKERVDDTYNWFTALVVNDVVDKDEAEKLIRANAPNYLSTARNKDGLDEWLRELDRLTKDAERRAEWRSNEGKPYMDRMKPENRPTAAQLTARLEHTALSMTGGAVKAAPLIIMGTVGGPLVAGLIGAASVATFVDPRTRYATAVFIGAHPEEFFASVAGALAAGMAVSQANQMWGKYKTQLKAAEVKKLQAQYDKMIDDYTYLEQIKGQEFPSTLAEQTVFNKFLENLTPSERAQYIKAVKEDWSIYYDSGSQILEPVFVKEIVKMYPELRDPFLHPAFKDPNILNKSNLVARVPTLNANATPLLTAALAIVAQQGYITDAQIKELIAENMKLIELYKEKGIIIQAPWTLQDLSNLTLTEAAQIVDVVPTSITDVTNVQVAVQDIQPIQTAEQVPATQPVTDVEPVPTAQPPDKQPPRGSGGRFIPRRAPEKRRQEQVSAKAKGRRRFRVVFTYARGGKDTVRVEAQTYPEAMSLAQRRRQIRKDQPVEVNLWAQAD